MATLSLRANKRHFTFGTVDKKTVEYFNKHDINLDRYNNFLAGTEDEDEPALKINDKFNFAQGHTSLFAVNDIADFYGLELTKDSYLEVLDDKKEVIYLSRLDFSTLLPLGVKIIVDIHYGAIVINNSSKKETVLSSNNGDTYTDNYSIKIDDEFDLTQLTFYCYVNSSEFFIHKITYGSEEIIINNKMNKDVNERWASFDFTNPDWV